MYLIFDTETTGFPRTDYKDPNNARVTQLGWKLYNSDNKCFKTFDSLIKPDGWKIPTVDELIAQGNKKPTFFVDHNMSTERCEKEGRPMHDVMKHFIQAVEESKFIIAHNMKFDLAMMAHEMYRLSVEARNKPVRICTMKDTTDILKLPAKTGFKKPSLMELHQWLFQKPFDGAHDALSDVIACADCFFELKKRELFKFEEPKFESSTHDKQWLNEGSEPYLYLAERLRLKTTLQEKEFVIEGWQVKYNISNAMKEKLLLL